MHNKIAYACIVCLMMIYIDLMHLRYKKVQARGLCVWLAQIGEDRAADSLLVDQLRVDAYEVYLGP